MTKVKIPIEEKKVEIPDVLPVLPLRDMVIFPHMVVPLVVGRDGTKQAVESAMAHNRLVALVAQRDGAVEEPSPNDLHRFGLLGRISHLMRLPNGLVKVLVEGLLRFKVKRFSRKGAMLFANIHIVKDPDEFSDEIEAAQRHLAAVFKEFITLNRQIPDEIAVTVDQIPSPRYLADFVAIHLNRDLKFKQNVLENEDLYATLLTLAREVKKENQILSLEQNIEGKVKEKISKSQRNFYLQEQLRAIKKELGEEAEDDLSDVIEYRRKVRKAKMPRDARLKAEEEIRRLEATPMLSPEATVIRNYLDWLIDVPWHKASEDNKDIGAAEKILEADHYGLEKPKERIIEHLSILALAGRMRGPILCFVGPPGVGKTSLARSIARALGRSFVRVSLGGVRDEAEIRGHRRTYIGALPGRVIQSMKRAGTVNPLFLLDEVDKMSTDFRGDPSSALLEVLDPEQNNTFSDHYLEVEYDLSQVLFITTANSRDGIPWPLQDRMEIIEIPGYLHQEKFHIARQFLVPKQLQENGLKEGQIVITDSALNHMIEAYTREAGVRELERCIAKVMRKGARELLSENKLDAGLKVDHRRAARYLGVAPFEERRTDGQDKVGAALGLAWTPTGGDILLIEADTMAGKGSLTLTGSLGTVMQESARAALTAVRSRSDSIGFDSAAYLESEIHVHVPEGAVSKDGPSAGITIAVAIASALSGRKVRGDIALTGEITLRGDVLPIGGLREKLMAALRAGVKKVIIPGRNKRELAEVPAAVRKSLNIITVSTVDEVLKLILMPVGESGAEEVRPKRRARSNTAVSRVVKSAGR